MVGAEGRKSMTHRLWPVILLATISLGIPSALADDDNGVNLGRMSAGYTYFNRPGATMAMSKADLGTCIDDTSGLMAAQARAPNGPTPLGELLFGSAKSAQRGVIAGGLENCMVVHGWRVVRLDDAEGDALSKLPPAELAAKLAAWVGADNPRGTIVRTWRNDAALACAKYYALRVSPANSAQLTMLAVAPDIEAAVGDAVGRRPPGPRGNAALIEGNEAAPLKPTLSEKLSRKPTPPDMLDAAPPGSAVIIFNVKGSRIVFVVFDRMIDTRTGFDASSYGVTARTSHDGKFVAFVVPAGVWRVASFSDGMLSLNFCLGSPGFVVKPDEVVYAGQIDFDQPKLVPQFDLPGAKAWLGQSRAADRLRAATYRNGTRGGCVGTGAYALEFDGTPFVEDYAAGSKVPPLVAKP